MAKSTYLAIPGRDMPNRKVPGNYAQNQFCNATHSPTLGRRRPEHDDDFLFIHY
ncbi:hypothetical protein PL9631_780038 [Planktothrix paucivesiculata PCC 9631]|uniref:Uncharacterized protein n=1 Tax=Planktothrix paucivesiculata PCC 9631 TaxID=671071 RepID=A0A7Z9E587_9CYAN|nr:hypothetical protein PL9631_780038 [Planktothrix paucivesiculata PCC 9631]